MRSLSEAPRLRWDDLTPTFGWLEIYLHIAIILLQANLEEQF